jgi:hypothetical protein
VHAEIQKDGFRFRHGMTINNQRVSKG